MANVIVRSSKLEKSILESALFDRKFISWKILQDSCQLGKSCKILTTKNSIFARFLDAIPLLFSVEKKFPKKIIQFSRRPFFPFPETAYDAQNFRVCIVVGVLYNTSVGCHRSSEAGSGGFDSRYRS